MRPTFSCLVLFMLGLILVLTGCQTWDGQLTLGRYTTRPNYESSIRTVRIPVFINKTQVFQGNSGIENELTQAVIREVESKTPFKVLPANAEADTELTGVITSFTKGIINRNQLNEVREAETYLTVEVVWKDLRTGEILSQPHRKVLDSPNAAFNLPEPGAPEIKPVKITSTGSFIPELGQSTSTARQVNFDRIASQITRMMEKPW